MSDPALAPSARTSPPEVPDVYYLETLDQLRVLSDPLRYRMALLLETPATCAGLARALGLSRAKAHYHLKLLDAHGLVQPHSEALNNGIVEKYYVVRGRMLDFSRLMPLSEAEIPANVAPETVGAIGGFLAAMLQVSGEQTRGVASPGALSRGHYFDFEATVDAETFEAIRSDLRALRQRVLAAGRTEADGSGTKAVRFHITNYLTPLESSE